MYDIYFLMELPLPATAFSILFALASGDKHGYAIMRETHGMGPATLYTTIQRLLESRYIREVAAPENADSRRRYYRLTDDGTSALKEELERMEAIVKKSKGLRLRPSESAS